MKIILESNLPFAENGASFSFQNPVKIIQAHQLQAVLPALQALDEATKNGFWAAGYLAYEAGYAFEEAAFKSLNANHPLLLFGIFEAPTTPPLLDNRLDATLSPPKFEDSFEAYAQQIQQVKSHIFEGDVYQINYTIPLTGSFSGHPYHLYQQLKNKQKTAYSAYMEFEESQILSFSPELFFHRKGNQIYTQPMKGTLENGGNETENLVLGNVLQQDAKNRAENLMIVDLLRNDLSVICKTGSVEVPKLFEISNYETLLQMTSTVSGVLKEEVTYVDIFRALFPCGSITGAPKRRAMQLIQGLEQAERGIYCGSIGYISPHQEAVFNVAIRTLLLSDKKYKMGVGSGIVWDSDAADEFKECALKAKFLG